MGQEGRFSQEGSLIEPTVTEKRKTIALRRDQRIGSSGDNDFKKTTSVMQKRKSGDSRGTGEQDASGKAGRVHLL